MAKYSFREEGPLALKGAKRANAQRIGTELERIAKANNGTLTPRATVDAATDERNYLHRFFEWNNERAADAHRLDQARYLIRVIRVVDETRQDSPVRMAFLSVSDGKAGRSYIPLANVIDSPRLSILVLEQAERDLAAWQRRYSELADLCAEVGRLRSRLADRRRRVAGGDGDRPQAS
jgi:hypothetical protein